MKLNPFKKDPAKKEAKQEKDDIFDEVKAQISKEISEIEKITSREERITRYEALNKKLLAVYNDGKPVPMDGAGFGTAVGGTTGLMVGMVTSIGVAVAFPLAAPAVVFGIWGAAAAAGAASGGGLGGLIGGKGERKELRTKYGSIRNAQDIYKLQKTITKNLEKDREVILAREQKEKEAIRLREHNEKLRENFNKNYKEQPAPVVKQAPAQAKPARPEQKVLRKGGGQIIP